MSDDRGVSRVVYDAALTRVMFLNCERLALEKFDPCAQDGVRCDCRNITLAGLGLDEPPTEDEVEFTSERVTPEQIEALDDLLATPWVEDQSVDEPPTEATGTAAMVEEFNTHPNSLGREHVRALAPTLIREESDELLEALKVADAPLAPGGDLIARRHVARELADVVYVAYTAAWVHGIDLDAALVEIHRAAMNKVEANVRRESDGKIVKPPGFVPPDMTAAIGGSGMNPASVPPPSETPKACEWGLTGMVDTGRDPVGREWACKSCDARVWSQTVPVFACPDCVDGETPKACPTCKAHREAMLSALTSLNTGPLKDGYAAAVLEDALSGIDGGTA